MVLSLRHSRGAGILVQCGAFLLAGTLAWAQTQANGAAGTPSHALLVVRARCLPCHSGTTKRSGLDVSTREALLQGGDRGPGVIPGDPENSLIYQAIAHIREPHMPFQAEKLPADVITEIAAWIKAGANYDRRLDGATEITTKPTAQAGKTHWAFQPPKATTLPAVKDSGWVRNPIDAFIASEQEKRGLVHSPAASKPVLLRRVYLDVTGLPPTRQEMEDFLGDRSGNAYEKVVDRLLASPRYGERWGRHWMDVWRYSDWYGWRKQNEVRYSQRHIWHWRDWIVDSLNRDKGYDRMIVEMFAGDEIAPKDPDVIRATGYLARSWQRYSHNSWLQDAVDYTAGSFLGVTLKCARCHDHKYDPFSQEEYYRLRAFFEPYDVRVDRLSGEPDTEKGGLPRAFDDKIDAQTFRFIRGNEDNPDKSKPLAPGVPAVLGGGPVHIQPVALPIESYYPDFREFVHRDLVKQARLEMEKAGANLEKARQEVDAARRRSAESPGKESQAAVAQAEQAAALAEREKQTARTRLPAVEARIAADEARFASPPAANLEALSAAAKRAEYTANLSKVQECLLRVEQQLQDPAAVSDPDNKEVQKKLTEARKQLKAAQDALEARVEYTPIGQIYPDSSTGRRLALARWIANRQNPLTARVAVNHIWLRHFGRALVPTVENFGLNGKPPSHPALLDWLAVKFMESGWSMKAIHRLILTSRTYQMQSGFEQDDNRSIDPENIYLWRMNARRMEAEIVRDSLLQIAGQLDTTMGGPELDEGSGETSYRRSLYFRHAPDIQMTFLKLFDGANPVECYERGESIVPQQALALVNSRLSSAMAKALAEKLSLDESSRSGAAFIRAVFAAVLNREPTTQELAECQRFLHAQAELVKSPIRLTQWKAEAPGGVEKASPPELRARVDLVHALFSHNDFVTIR